MLISVIVPIYKVEQYLERCVDSILNQTFTDFELVLVDDGSPDNCGAICDEYAKKDERIVVIHKENGGLSDARNAGIEWALKNSDSQWITFIDSDDWVHIDYLKLLYNAAKENNVSISSGRFVKTLNNDEVTKHDFLSAKLVSPEEYYVEDRVNAIVAWGKLYKKSLWGKIRYPYGKIHEDEFTTYKLLFANEKIAVIDNILYYYFTNPNGIMGQGLSIRCIDFFDALEKQLIFYKKNNYIKAYKLSLKTYYDRLLPMCIKLNDSSDFDEYKKIKSILKNKLCKVLKRHNKELDISFSKDKWLYELAYPLLMKYYWIFSSQFNKIISFKKNKEH